MWDADQGDGEEDGDEGIAAGCDGGGSSISDDEPDEEMVAALYSQIHHQHQEEAASLHDREDELSQSTPRQQPRYTFSVEDLSESSKPFGGNIDERLESASAKYERLENVIDLTSSVPNQSSGHVSGEKINMISTKKKRTKVGKVKKNKKDTYRLKAIEYVVIEQESSESEDVAVISDSDISSNESDDSIIVLDVASKENTNSGKDIIMTNVVNHLLQDVTPFDVRHDSHDINVEDMTLEEIHRAMPDDNWDVIPQDHLPSYLQHSRYYTPKRMKCRNCNESGHMSKTCPRPKKNIICLFCGNIGHRNRSCPSMICYNCYKPGHEMKYCEEPRFPSNHVCHRCNCCGHAQKNCPDVWRQYHITTTLGPIVSIDQKENSKRYCYNCAKKGHFGYECESVMMIKNQSPNCPFVSYYNTKKELTNEKKRGSKPKPDRSIKRKLGDRGSTEPKKKQKLSHYGRSVLENFEKKSSFKSTKKQKMEYKTVGDFPRDGLSHQNHKEKIVDSKKKKAKKSKSEKIDYRKKKMRQNGGKQKQLKKDYAGAKKKKHGFVSKQGFLSKFSGNGI